MIELAPKVLLFPKALDVPENLIQYIESLNVWDQHFDIGQMSEDGSPVASFAFFHKEEFDEALFAKYEEVCRKALNEYSLKYLGRRAQAGPNTIEIKKYGEGGFYESHQHNPDDPDMSKKTKVVTYINDNYDGGELVFSDYGVEHKPSAGDVLVFPSDYWIEVRPSINGIKYVVMDAIQI